MSVFRQRSLNMTVFLALAGIILFGPSLLAQTADQVKTVVAGGTTDPAPNGTNEWGSSVVWAFLSASLLEWVKRHRNVTLISERTTWAAQRAIGIVLAAGAALGIHATFDSAAGVLTVSGLFWPNIYTAAGETLRQWVFQEISYRTAVKHYRKDGLS